MMPDGASFLAGYVPYLLRQADQALSARFYATLTEHGVARSEWRVLAVLHDHRLDQLPVVDLAAEALSPQPTVTHALRRLEERGLVTRTKGQEDRRQRFISITDAGATLTAGLIAEAKRLEAEALADVDPGELEVLIGQLQTLTQATQATQADHPISRRAS